MPDSKPRPNLTTRLGSLLLAAQLETQHKIRPKKPLTWKVIHHRDQIHTAQPRALRLDALYLFTYSYSFINLYQCRKVSKPNCPRR